MCFFCTAGSQFRAGMRRWLRIHFCRADRSASPLPDCGLGRVCLTLWSFKNYICHRMLVRELVHGMQGAGEKQKIRSNEPRPSPHEIITARALRTLRFKPKSCLSLRAQRICAKPTRSCYTRINSREYVVEGFVSLRNYGYGKLISRQL